MAAVLAGALGYLGWMLAGNWDRTRESLAALDPVLLALAVLPCLAMYLAKAWYHALIVRQLHPPLPDPLPVMTAYCQAQIVRYLPGKIWGVLYQAGRLGAQVPAGTVIVANAVQTLHTQLFAVGFCGVVLLAAAAGDLRWLWLLPVGAALMFGLHRSTLTERWGLALMARLMRRPLPTPEAPPTGLSLRVVLLLSFDWLVFCAAWLLLVQGRLDPWAAIVLAACYGVSSLLATLALVVPAGLVLREALFVSLGQRLQFDAQDLLSLSLVARLVFTASELACVPLLAALRRTRPA